LDDRERAMNQREQKHGDPEVPSIIEQRQKAAIQSA
jgi:hypothetical protein